MITKEGTVEEFDYDSFLDNKNAAAGHNSLGLPAVSDGVKLYSVAETVEEAELRLKVDKLSALTSELELEYQPEDKKKRSKQYTTAEVYDKFVERT